MTTSNESLFRTRIEKLRIRKSLAELWQDMQTLRASVKAGEFATYDTVANEIERFAGVVNRVQDDLDAALAADQSEPEPEKPVELPPCPKCGGEVRKRNDIQSQVRCNTDCGYGIESIVTLAQHLSPPAAPEPVKPIPDEKQRRIYYQSIVYKVCNQLDRLGTKLVCGTLDAPSQQVQDRVEEIVNDLIEARVDRELMSNPPQHEGDPPPPDDGDDGTQAVRDAVVLLLEMQSERTCKFGEMSKIIKAIAAIKRAN